MFFGLTWTTKNKIYLNKYLMRVITISIYTVTINKYKRVGQRSWSNIKLLEINISLSKLNETNISKRFLICWNFLIKILQQWHWRNSRVSVITFWHDIMHLDAFIFYSACQMVQRTQDQRFKAQHCTLPKSWIDDFLGILQKLQMNYFSNHLFFKNLLGWLP